MLLLRYRSWRDEHVLVRTDRFVRTRSGSISTSYTWKLTKRMAARAEVRLVYDAEGNAIPDPNGVPLTEVTPHSLRRTFVSDLGNRGVPTIAITPIVGHSSPRVTEESYALASKERQARQVILAAGDGPFSLTHGVSELDRDLTAARELTPADPVAALAELRRIQAAAAALEESVVRVAPEARRDGTGNDPSPNGRSAAGLAQR